MSAGVPYTDIVGDPNTWNPKKGIRRKGSVRIWELSKLPDPIPAQIEDGQELQDIFKLGIVPYAGTVMHSGDSLLNFFIRMSELAPTQAACREGIKRYSFGGKIQVVNMTDPLFDLDQEADVPAETRKGFVNDLLNQIDLNGLDYDQLACNIYDDAKKTGNAWLEVMLVETAGVKSVAFRWHKMKHIRFKLTKKGEPRVVLVSPIWTKTFLDKNPPDVLAVYPNFLDEGDGVFRTMIQYKNGPFEWYGRPDSSGSILSQFREFQDLMYQVKSAANEYTGRTILEFEDDNPAETDRRAQQAGYDDESDRVNENFTNDGYETQSVLVTTRPFGAKQMAIHQVKPNTNESWFVQMGEEAERKIIMSNQWSRMLLDDSNGTGLSNNAFIDALKSKLPVINANQSIPETVINKAIAIAVEWLGLESFKNLGLNYRSPYQDILEQSQEEGNEEGVIDQRSPEDQLKALMDAYGVGVRAGTITPIELDEEYFRSLLNLPPVNEAAREAWKADQGFRRPITLSSGAEVDANIDEAESDDDQNEE